MSCAGRPTNPSSRLDRVVPLGAPERGDVYCLRCDAQAGVAAGEFVAIDVERQLADKVDRIADQVVHLAADRRSVLAFTRDEERRHGVRAGAW